VTERETFRLAPPVIFWWVWVGFVALNVIDYAVQGLPSAHFGAVVGAILLLVTGLVYTLALRPRVLASGDGITVLNPYRTHRVPWQLITAVDTGEWVQVHYAPAVPGGDAVPGGADGPSGAAGPGGDATPGGTAEPGRGFGAEPAAVASSANAEKVFCWALYVSARGRRKIAAGPPRQRDPGRSRSWVAMPSLFGGNASADASGGAGYGSSRLPAEAKYLASLPPAKAMSIRLDSRADRERARLAGQAAYGGGADDGRADGGGRPRATAAWCWPALAAVVVPALIVLGVALA
jgi:hypothetical protein